MTEVVAIGSRRARRDPEVAKAITVLAALDDATAESLGCWRRPDGSLGDWITREEWRAGLLAGEVDPVAFCRNIALIGYVMSPAFDEMLAAKRAADGDA